MMSKIVIELQADAFMALQRCLQRAYNAGDNNVKTTVLLISQILGIYINTGDGNATNKEKRD